MLAENALVKLWQTMTHQEEEVLEHLAELDRQEQVREDERTQTEIPARDEPAARP